MSRYGDALPSFATPAQASRRRTRYDLYQQGQGHGQGQQVPLYKEQAPSQLQQPIGLPAQNTGEAQREYEKCRRTFMRFDRDRSNSLSADELVNALYNADGTKFDMSTVVLMVKLFDEDNSRTLDFREFYFLCQYLRHWSNTFKKADKNRSGTISLSEFATALTNFGYRMNYGTVEYIFNMFARQPRTSRHAPAAPANFNNGVLNIDKFVECLVHILRLTNVFRKYDFQGNAVATFGFEQFICEGMALMH